MDGWKTIFLLGPGNFSGAKMLVLERVLSENKVIDFHTLGSSKFLH